MTTIYTIGYGGRGKDDLLGLIKAQVCDPSTLLLSTRHAKVRQQAEDAHREKWGGQDQEIEPVRRRKRRRNT